MDKTETIKSIYLEILIEAAERAERTLLIYNIQYPTNEAEEAINELTRAIKYVKKERIE